MRKQPKARTTKSKSRQDSVYEVGNRLSKNENNQVELQLKMTRLGGKVAELKKLYKSYGEKVILKGMEYTFKRAKELVLSVKTGLEKYIYKYPPGIEQPDSGKGILAIQ